MNNMCSEEESLKAGLKLALGTLIQQCCAILIDHYATSGQRSVAGQIREFKELFFCETHYAKLMATAEYQLKEKRHLGLAWPTRCFRPGVSHWSNQRDPSMDLPVHTVGLVATSGSCVIQRMYLRSWYICPLTS